MKFIPSTKPGESYVRVNGSDENMTKTPMTPGQCHQASKTKYLDTCRANNIVSMRIEGELEDGSDWTYKEEELVIETLNTEAPTEAPTPKQPTASNPNLVKVEVRLI